MTFSQDRVVMRDQLDDFPAGMPQWGSCSMPSCRIESIRWINLMISKQDRPCMAHLDGFLAGLYRYAGLPQCESCLVTL